MLTTAIHINKIIRLLQVTWILRSAFFWHFVNLWIADFWIALIWSVIFLGFGVIIRKWINTNIELVKTRIQTTSLPSLRFFSIDILFVSMSISLSLLMFADLFFLQRNQSIQPAIIAEWHTYITEIMMLRECLESNWCRRKNFSLSCATS